MIFEGIQQSKIIRNQFVTMLASMVTTDAPKDEIIAKKGKESVHALLQHIIEVSDIFGNDTFK